mgnify:CR=1 FL=1
MPFLILVIIICMIVALFAVQNAVAVSLNFVFWSFSASLVLVILGAFLMGVLVATCFLLTMKAKHYLKDKKMREEMQQLQAENKRLQERVAMREASIYTGITIAEYYRDMGYDIAIMADSTSRWAEALREISGRLEEMPAEEGFPAYLPSRLSEFYERAANADTLSGKRGSVTIIGAVSPQGSDFSEPVTQNTKRFVRCFLALDKSLAYARHYPAINWITSYSEYVDDFTDYYKKNVGEDFLECRQKISNLLLEENKLMEIVKLIGADVLPDDQKLIIETAKVIRIGFLQQNAFHKDDTYVPLSKQLLMMKAILHLHEKAFEAINRGVTFSRIAGTDLFDRLIKMKYDIPNDKPELFAEYDRYTDETLEAM